MKNIIYECGLSNTLSGGFGDRLIGIISCISLCEKYNCRFFIKWHDTPLNEYFDYELYDYFNFTFSSNTNKICSHNTNELIQHFCNKEAEDFNCENLIVNTNQNIWQLNNNYNSQEEYEEYTYTLFKTLFNVYLKPKTNLLTSINEIIDNKSIIGIQLRFGDVFMNVENTQINNPQYNHFPLGRNINMVRNTILTICNDNPDKHIFITSDIDINKIINMSELKNVLYYNKPPVHIERSINKTDIEKCYIDFLILCKCEKLYITFESNFGRIPGIILKNNVYAINSSLEVNPISINELSSKRY
jgi:hypothetical protein